MFVNTTCFDFNNFSSAVDKLMVRYMLMSPCCEIREEMLAKKWSVKDVFLQNTYRTFIICFNSNVVQN